MRERAAHYRSMSVVSCLCGGDVEVLTQSGRSGMARVVPGSAEAVAKDKARGRADRRIFTALVSASEEEEEREEKEREERENPSLSTSCA